MIIKPTVKKKLDKLISDAIELIGHKIDVEVFKEDTYYIKDEDRGQCYALVESTTNKKGYKHRVFLAARQSPELLYDNFAHELGHIIIAESEEVVADILGDYLRKRIKRK